MDKRTLIVTALLLALMAGVATAGVSIPGQFTADTVRAKKLKLDSLLEDTSPDSALSVVGGVVRRAAWPGGTNNPDSLGGNPWTAYLRSDIADTASGMKWFPDSLDLGTYGTGSTRLNFLTKCNAYYDQSDGWGQWTFYGGYGLTISHQTYAPNPSHAALRILEYDPVGIGLLMSAETDLTTGHLIQLTGNSKVGGYDLMKIGEVGPGCHGMGIYTASANAIGTYYDVGDSGIGALVECNEHTDLPSRGIKAVSMGLGIPLDIGVDSTQVPAIVIRDSSYGQAQDSSLYYSWGSNVTKHLADTVGIKTPDGLSTPYFWATNDTRIWALYYGVSGNFDLTGSMTFGYLGITINKIDTVGADSIYFHFGDGSKAQVPMTIIPAP